MKCLEATSEDSEEISKVISFGTFLHAVVKAHSSFDQTRMGRSDSLQNVPKSISDKELLLKNIDFNKTNYGSNCCS